MEKKYKVYLITNMISGHQYVGFTSLPPKKRWSNGKGYKENVYFYNAIKKYGWNNFKKEILEENLTQQEAKEKEIFYINKFDTFNNGYNKTLGGDSGIIHTPETKEKISIASKNMSKESRLAIAKKLSKTVYQYDLDGNFIKKFPSCSSAGKELNISSAHITAVCNGIRKTIGGFIFKYYKSNKIKPVENKKVVQLSKEGFFIREFENASQASKILKIERSKICSICNHYPQRQTAGGFKWLFASEYERLNNGH